MDVRAEYRGRPRQKLRFPAALVVGRNLLTPGHPGVRVGNVAGNPDRKVYDYAAFSSLKKGFHHMIHANMGNVFFSPTPTTCLKSTAVHLQFVRQYAPHLHRRTFLASKLRRKGSPAIRLPFVLQYPSHLYGSTPPHLHGSTFGEILG